LKESLFLILFSLLLIQEAFHHYPTR